MLLHHHLPFFHALLTLTCLLWQPFVDHDLMAAEQSVSSHNQKATLKVCQATLSPKADPRGLLPYLLGLLVAGIAYALGRRGSRPTSEADVIVIAPEEQQRTQAVLLAGDGKLTEVRTLLIAYNMILNDPPGEATILMSPAQLLAFVHERDQSRDRLVLRDKMFAQNMLAAGIAHEVANPIGFVAGSAENMQADLEKFHMFLFAMLGDEADPEVVASFKNQLEPLDEHLTIILGGCDRIRETTRELQAFARSAPGGERRVAVEPLLENVIYLVKARYKRRANIELELVEQPFVKGHAAELVQAFMAILLNACQSMERKQEREKRRNPGDLNVKLFTSDQQVLVEVCDSGEGMSPADQSKIAQAGYSTREDGGTGMGFTLTQCIMADHRGKIEVESTLGMGSTVTLSLPLSPESDKATVVELFPG